MALFDLLVTHSFTTLCARIYAQVMLQGPRTMFAKHKAGHIFPIALSISALEHSFVGAVHQIRCADEVIWFYTDTLSVCEASEQSLRLMGVSSLQNTVSLRIFYRSEYPFLENTLICPRCSALSDTEVVHDV